jgi:hypothetical protein
MIAPSTTTPAILSTRASSLVSVEAVCGPAGDSTLTGPTLSQASDGLCPVWNHFAVTSRYQWRFSGAAWSVAQWPDLDDPEVSEVATDNGGNPSDSWPGCRW